MSGRERDTEDAGPRDGESPGRRATIRTTHDDPDVVAASVAPDNTAEMETRSDDGTVVTRIERETTGGLHSTVDDYVVNVDVATTVAQRANRPADADDASGSDTHQTDTHP